MSKDNIVSLLNGFTVELNPKVRHKLNSIPLDKKNNVYITYLPDATEKDILETVEFVSSQNLVPITHLPARTMKDLEHVSSFLKELRKRTDSKKILVIGGGGNQNGSISSSLEILESDLLNDNDFTEIGIAGHPEGSKDIDPDGSTKNVDEALSWKNEFSKRTDASMAITTQFSFDSKTVIDWANGVKKAGIDIPIHIGIAGPAKLQTLLRYSIECGVGASVKIIQKRAKDLTKLLLPYKPTTIISELADYKSNNPDFNIEKVHFYPLGGITQVSDFVKSA